MNVYFEDDNLRDLFCRCESSKYKALSRDKQFMDGVARLFVVLLSTPRASDLRMFSFLHYEKLKHIGLSSVRILNGRVERLLFRETEDGITITIIELNTKHYGRKR